jgi:hypothetical protein
VPAFFPPLDAETLEKRAVRLPGDFAGERNLLLVAFQHKQQALIDTWSKRAPALAALDPALRVYEIPAIKKMPGPIRWMIASGMRRGIADAATRDRTIALFIDKAPFERALRIDDESTVYALVVNRTGEVLWRAAGAYDDAAGARLAEFLKTAAAAAPAR